MEDAEELAILRWKPTYADLNAPFPEGVPHKVLTLWQIYRVAEGQKKNQPKAFGSIGEEIADAIEEELG